MTMLFDPSLEFASIPRIEQLCFLIEQAHTTERQLQALMATASSHGSVDALLAFADHDGGLSRLFNDAGLTRHGVAEITSTEGLIESGQKIVGILSALSFAHDVGESIAKEWGEESKRADDAIRGAAANLQSQLAERRTRPLITKRQGNFLQREAALSALAGLERAPQLFEKICSLSLPVNDQDLELYYDMIANICKDFWRSFAVEVTGQSWSQGGAGLARLSAAGALEQLGWTSPSAFDGVIDGLRRAAITNQIAMKGARWVKTTRVVSVAHGEKGQGARSRAIAYVGRIAIFLINRLICQWTTHIAQATERTMKAAFA